MYRRHTPEVFTSSLLSGFLSQHPILENILDRVYLSTAVSTGGNMARYISLEAGLPVKTPAITIMTNLPPK